MAVAVSPDNRTVVSGSYDQTVRLWDLESGRNLVTIFVGTDKEWVAWTPNGYYTSSVKGDRYIGWHLNQGVDKAAKFYGGAQFQKELYRPDVVSEYLKSRDIEVAVRVANDRRGGAFRGQVAATPADLQNFLPPIVYVITPDQEETVVSTDTVNLKAVALSNTLPISDVKVFLNGRQVAGAKPGETRGDPGSVGSSWISPSSRREHTDSHRVEREGRRGTGVSTGPLWGPAGRHATGSDSLDHRRLRVQGLEVTPLEFAHKDALEVDRTLALQEGLAFKKVKRKSLTNKQATRKDIFEALHWLRTEGEPTDYRMLFLSGHANMDKQANDFFFSHEHDPSAGDWEIYSIKWSAIMERLAGLGKTILMVDTCRAAAVAGGGRPKSDTNFDQILKQMLSEYRGIALFTAATGREISIERSDWGHGAFTLALREGLGGQADGYGGDKDGFIEIKELGAYISNRVRQLTGGTQNANYTLPPELPSFPFVQVRK